VMQLSGTAAGVRLTAVCVCTRTGVGCHTLNQTGITMYSRMYLRIHTNAYTHIYIRIYIYVYIYFGTWRGYILAEEFMK